jgi:hypothetical protein
MGTIVFRSNTASDCHKSKRLGVHRPRDVVLAVDSDISADVCSLDARVVFVVVDVRPVVNLAATQVYVADGGQVAADSLKTRHEKVARSTQPRPAQPSQSQSQFTLGYGLETHTST